MKPAPFDYARPRRITEAAQLLASHAASARVLAGGQSLMPLLSRRIERPRLLIDINDLEDLGRIELLATHVRMGALVRQEDARLCPLVREHIPGVAEALYWVANPVIRQRGTVVGNLVTNSPGAELPAVALALGAQLVLRSADREQTVPAAAVLGEDGRLARDALVTHVLWPRHPGPVGFYEVARREGHAPVVSALVAWHEGECRLALSGVCATGVSCAAMARVVERCYPEPPLVTDLAAALRNDLAAPVFEDAYSSARYRLEVAPVVSQRAAQAMTVQARAA